jgi:hypothetical protein
VASGEVRRFQLSATLGHCLYQRAASSLGVVGEQPGKCPTCGAEDRWIMGASSDKAFAQCQKCGTKLEGPLGV